MMEKKIVDQKEYLKKYLSSGHGEDKKKKKKRKMKVGAQTVKIIDDDLDLKNMRPVDENEFDMFVTAEDAPQIAGVVDERGSVDFSDKRRWKIIADDEGGDLTITSTDRGIKQHKQTKNGSDNDLSPPRKRKEKSDDDLSPPRLPRRQKGGTGKKSKGDEDSDLSPPRMKHKKRSSSKRNASQNNSDSDSLQTDIPPYKNGKKMRRKGKASDDSDISPPRKSKKHKSKKGIKQRNEDDSDLSPPRKSRRNSDSDMSPPRRSKNHDSDLSPPRKGRREEIGKSMKQTNKDDSDLSPPRKSKRSFDSDTSPQRKSKAYDSDLSPPRNGRKHDYRKKGSDSDLSPPRRKHEKDIHATSKYKGRNYEPDMNASRETKKCRDSYSDARRDRCSDLSPQRQHRYKDERLERNKDYRYSEKDSRPYKRHHDANTNPPQKMNKDRDTSSNRFRGDDRDFYKSKPSRFNDRHDRESKYSQRDEPYAKEKKSKQRDADDETNEKRMKKTLDGKTAGLQDARALREETEAHKRREAEQFSKLSKDVTGVGQAAIVRDTKTGRKRNLEAEAAEEREKQKRQAELNAQYAKWGKGLKQVEDREDKLKDDLYEMSKPLARYADDADLDQRLREQDREGDPMLDYIKQKQIKEGKRKPDRPKYEGSSMPNRFGVKPGHRWDGVDRSNGYEKRWFEAQNAKVARQEEAYKWSTSDM